MRILFSIHHQLDVDSGAPGATMALGEHLRQLDHEVAYLSFDDLPGRPPFRAASLAFPFFAALKIAAAARRGLDVVDASTGDAWLWARVARRHTRPLLVTRSHGLEHLFQAEEIKRIRLEGKRPSWRYPLYWGGWRLREVAMSLRASDLVFVLSDEERSYVIEQLGVSPERVRVTVNGVPDAFLERARAAAERDHGPGVAVLGAYRLSKGVAHGSAALAAALEADPEMRVSFLGTGVPAATVLERFPAPLRSRVTVVERYRREDLPELLTGSSTALFPSLSEGLSLALVEAMTCGLVPVASDIPGNRAIVDDGVNGILVPTGDAPAATAALQRLRSDAELLGRLRTAAREVGPRFSWSLIAQETAAAYDEALEKRRR
jgi:glycosyltransferase involved in cell wall biosynthesis